MQLAHFPPALTQEQFLHLPFLLQRQHEGMSQDYENVILAKSLLYQFDLILQTGRHFVPIIQSFPQDASSLASQPLPPLFHSYERAGEGSGLMPIQIPFQRGGA